MGVFTNPNYDLVCVRHLRMDIDSISIVFGSVRYVPYGSAIWKASKSSVCRSLDICSSTPQRH